MPEFRLTQISDTHLSRNQPRLSENFHRVSEYISATRPDLVVNSGDLTFDGPTNPDDFPFARSLHDALRVECRFIPGNHDIGDNPTAVGSPPTQPVTPATCAAFVAAFGEDHWRFEELTFPRLRRTEGPRPRLRGDDEKFTFYPARPAPAACRNWRPSRGP